MAQDLLQWVQEAERKRLAEIEHKARYAPVGEITKRQRALVAARTADLRRDVEERV